MFHYKCKSVHRKKLYLQESPETSQISVTDSAPAEIVKQAIIIFECDDIGIDKAIEFYNFRGLDWVAAFVGLASNHGRKNGADPYLAETSLSNT